MLKNIRILQIEREFRPLHFEMSRLITAAAEHLTTYLHNVLANVT